jgi:hypothetical protein
MTSQLNSLIAQQSQAEPVSRRANPARQVEEMYDRGLAHEKPRRAPFHAGALAEAAGYPPLCAHGMNSLTDTGYDLALGRLRRG